MSSPVHNDLDKRAMYAPPWARETPQQPPQAIIAAIERLRQERLRTTDPSPHEVDAADAQSRHNQRDRDQPELPLAERTNPDDIEAAMAEAVRAAWTPPPLEPVTMPEPPKLRLGGPTWGMVGRLSGAVGFAATVALFVTGAVPLPSIDISLYPDEGAKAAPVVAPAVGLGEVRGPKQPRVVVADALPSMAVATNALVALPPAAVPSSKAPLSSALPPEVLTAYASLDTASAPMRVPAGPKIEVPQVQGATPLPTLPEPRALERDELAGLVRRGQALLVEGDISSARLLLRRAAESGDAAAALMLAGSYDQAELAKLKVIGVAHDHTQAKIWYKKAVEHGSAEALRRLQQLAQRAE